MARWRRRLGVSAVVAGALAMGIVPHDARAQSVEAFYKATPLVLYVGSNAGGGFDLYTRVLARHLPNHIPGHPTAVVKNMPGAGGLKMVDYLYMSAPKDGSAIGTSTRTFFIEPMLGNKAVSYDVTKMRAIGSISPQTPVCAVWHTAPVKTLADAETTQVLLGGEGLNATVTYPTVLNAVLGTKFKIVTGYQGTPGITGAIERGEVQGVCLSWDTLKTVKPVWMKTGMLKPIVQMTSHRNPEIEDVPTVFDGVTNPDDEKTLRFFFAPDEMGRPYVAPPGVPEDRLRALRRAFDATMKDPAFVADGKKINVEVDPMTGEDMEALIAKIYATPKPLVDRVAGMLAKLRETH